MVQLNLGLVCLLLHISITSQVALTTASSAGNTCPGGTGEDSTEWSVELISPAENQAFIIEDASMGAFENVDALENSGGDDPTTIMNVQWAVRWSRHADDSEQPASDPMQAWQMAGLHVVIMLGAAPVHQTNEMHGSVAVSVQSMPTGQHSIRVVLMPRKQDDGNCRSSAVSTFAVATFSVISRKVLLLQQSIFRTQRTKVHRIEETLTYPCSKPTSGKLASTVIFHVSCPAVDTQASKSGKQQYIQLWIDGNLQGVVVADQAQIAVNGDEAYLPFELDIDDLLSISASTASAMLVTVVVSYHDTQEDALLAAEKEQQRLQTLEKPFEHHELCAPTGAGEVFGTSQHVCTRLSTAIWLGDIVGERSTKYSESDSFWRSVASCKTSACQSAHRSCAVHAVPEGGPHHWLPPQVKSYTSTSQEPTKTSSSSWRLPPSSQQRTHIVTFHVNRPDLMQLQIDAFWRMHKASTISGDRSAPLFTIVYDSHDSNMESTLLRKCQSLPSATCLHVPPSVAPGSMNPSEKHSSILDWLWQEYIIPHLRGQLVAVIDGDVIPLQNFPFDEFMLGFDMAGPQQHRGHTKYLASQLWVFNLATLHRPFQLSLAYSPDRGCDSGAHLHDYIEANPTTMVRNVLQTSHISMRHGNMHVLPLQLGLRARYKDDFAVELYERAFVHYGSVSGYKFSLPSGSMYQLPGDPYPAKTSWVQDLVYGCWNGTVHLPEYRFTFAGATWRHTDGP